MGVSRSDVPLMYWVVDLRPGPVGTSFQPEAEASAPT